MPFLQGRAAKTTDTAKPLALTAEQRAMIDELREMLTNKPGDPLPGGWNWAAAYISPELKSGKPVVFVPGKGITMPLLVSGDPSVRKSTCGIDSLACNLPNEAKIFFPNVGSFREMLHGIKPGAATVETIIAGGLGLPAEIIKSPAWEKASIRGALAHERKHSENWNGMTPANLNEPSEFAAIRAQMRLIASDFGLKAPSNESALRVTAKLYLSNPEVLGKAIYDALKDESPSNKRGWYPGGAKLAEIAAFLISIHKKTPGVSDPSDHSAAAGESRKRIDELTHLATNKIGRDIETGIRREILRQYADRHPLNLRGNVETQVRAELDFLASELKSLSSAMPNHP